MLINYNQVLLRIWQANTDIQPSGNIASVAYYVGKYANKCEPQDSGDISLEKQFVMPKDEGNPSWSKLFFVVMAIFIPAISKCC